MACVTGVYVSDESVSNDDISHDCISDGCISDNHMRGDCISDDHISDISHRRTLHSCTSVESKSSGSKSWPALESGRGGGGGGRSRPVQSPQACTGRASCKGKVGLKESKVAAAWPGRPEFKVRRPARERENRTSPQLKILSTEPHAKPISPGLREGGSAREWAGLFHLRAGG